MSFQNNIRALYLNFVGNRGGSISAITYDTFPDDDDISLTAEATANSFGAYVEVVSDTGADVWTIGIYVGNASAATDFKVEFATGAAASETPRAVIALTRSTITGAAQTLGNDAAAFGTMFNFPFPIHQPDNTRQAARTKSGSANADTIDVSELHALGLS